MDQIQTKMHKLYTLYGPITQTNTQNIHNIWTKYTHKRTIYPHYMDQLHKQMHKLTTLYGPGKHTIAQINHILWTSYTNK
jgi:hypothetical protein